MKYMGSKNRIAKYILPVILKDRTEGQWYVEPFCGGCNLIDKVTGNRIAGDSNFELIEAYKALQKGWTPPLDITEQLYFHIKNSTDVAKNLYGYELPAIRGIVGFAYSYAAKWFGGYCRGYTATGKPRDYIREGYNNVIRQVPFIKEIKFFCTSYDSLPIPPNSIIYCDPPYRNATKYKDSINYENFYQWCRDMKDQGHTIFISEYSMPSDFSCIWQIKQVSSLTRDTGGKTAVEKLFTL